MSLIWNTLQTSGIMLRTCLSAQVVPTRLICCSSLKYFQTENNTERPIETRQITKDRSRVIPVETSIAYLKSGAYKQTYGIDPVWKIYRRNFKGSYQPKKTRKTCIRQDMISTGNPCPICRDEYLILDYRNLDLLKQFLSPYNGETLSYSKTGICQKQHRNLLIALIKAKDYGYITFDVPIREYDYSEWQPEEKAEL